MTTRAEGLRSQVQGMLKQAVVQMGDVRGTVVRTVAERLDVDIDTLRKRRDRLVENFREQSNKLAQQERVPLPSVVKMTLGRVNTLLDQWVEQGEHRVEPIRQPSKAAGSARSEASANATGSAAKPSSNRRTGRSQGKPAAARPRKPRRPPTDHN